jgi:LPXTG-motif cell wall-anchored protein
VYSPPIATQLAATGASSISQLLLLAALLIVAGVALYVATKARPRVR